MSQSDIPEYGAPPVPPPGHYEEVQEPARLGPVQRFIGVLFSPGETFADVNRKATLIAPIIIGIIIALAGSTFFTWRVNPDWDRILRDQVRKGAERSGQPMPSEEVIQQQVSIGKAIAKFAPLFAIIVVPLYYAILAGIFALGLMLMQAKATFKKIMSVVAWSSCATGVIALLVTIGSLMLKDEASLKEIDPTRPATITVTNLGAFLDESVSAPIRAIASSIDIFTIWFLILLSIGFAAISGSRKIKSSKTGTLVFSLWIVWVLLLAGYASFFG